MPDVRRFPVTNTRTQRPGAAAKPAGRPLPAANSLEFLLAADAPATNNCALVTTQAVQAAVAALAQHQHLSAVGAQPAQAATASAAQHQHIAAAGAQLVQQSAAVSSSHEHLAAFGGQAAQTSEAAAAQHQHVGIVATQAAQAVDADLHSHVHIRAVTSQAAQSATAEAAQHQHMAAETGQHTQASVIASGEPVVANNAAMETTQAPQSSAGQSRRRRSRPAGLIFPDFTHGIAPERETQRDVAERPQRNAASMLTGQGPQTGSAVARQVQAASVSTGQESQAGDARATQTQSGSVSATQARQQTQGRASIAWNDLYALTDLDEDLTIALFGLAA